MSSISLGGVARAGAASRLRLAALDAVALALGWSTGWVVAAGPRAAPRRHLPLQARRHRRRRPRQHRLLRRLRAVPGPLPWHPVGRTRRRRAGHRRRRRRRHRLAGGLGDAAPGLAVGAAGGGFLAVITARYCLRRLAARLPAPGPLPHPGRGGGHRPGHRRTRRVPRRSTPRPASGRCATVGDGGSDGHPSGDVGAHAGDVVPDAVPWLGGYEPDGRGRAPAPAPRACWWRSTTSRAAPSRPLLHEVSAIGLPVHLSSGLTGFAPSRLRSMPLAHEPFLVLEPLQPQTTQRVVKRTIDLLVAVAGADAQPAAPGGAALAIKLHDRRPGAVPPDPGRPRRQHVPLPEAAHHGGRRRGTPRRPAGAATSATARCSSWRTTPGSPGSATASGPPPSTSCPSSSTCCGAT